MDWQQFIARFTAKELQELLGCPLRTIYSWREGRTPPEWVIALIMEKINRVPDKIAG